MPRTNVSNHRVESILPLAHLLRRVDVPNRHPRRRRVAFLGVAQHVLLLVQLDASRDEALLNMTESVWRLGSLTVRKVEQLIASHFRCFRSRIKLALLLLLRQCIKQIDAGNTPNVLLISDSGSLWPTTIKGNHRANRASINE